jgi:hypothetical protein
MDQCGYTRFNQFLINNSIGSAISIETQPVGFSFQLAVPLFLLF